MIRREVILVSVFMFLVMLGAAFASAQADVAYVYRKDFRIDDNILKVFNESNLTYDLINEKNLPVNFGNYRFIFVGDENFKYWNRILVNQFPSIVANYYHADDWGFTDSEGVSQLGATHPLSVRQDGRMIQVYTQATEYPSGPAIPYYYLDAENKAPFMQSIAYTETTSSGNAFGDVISYADPGVVLRNGRVQQSKVCFYGIIESDYWTPAAKKLFKDCLNFVAAECSVNSDCPAPQYSEPFCQNGDVYRTVTSSTCQANGFSKCVANESLQLVENCAYDCSLGACVGECTRDSDCGVSGSISDLFCVDKNVTQTFQNFKCLNAGTSNATCSVEIKNQTNQTCADACVGGICEDIACYNNGDCNDGNSTTEDICHLNGTVDSYCTNEPIRCSLNSDCGIDGFIGSPTCSGKNVTQIFKSWTCNNAGTAQSSCSSSEQTQVKQVCSDVCSGGACQDVTCFNDGQCDDGNPLTIDKCLNNGTAISECRHTPINCAVNSDCGFTGFLGQEFCSTSSIFKNYQTALCVNAGGTNSFCNVTVEQRLVSSCQYACSGNSCVRCDENSDCNDGNNLTADLCVNPGMLNSSCINPLGGQPIACHSDQECGQDTILSPVFCSGKNVSRLTQKWTCNNKGTTQSYCSSNTVLNVLQSCSDYCSNGNCVNINCFNDGECNDNNPATIDQCINAGTPQSYCSNPPSNISCYDDEDCGTDGFVGNPFCMLNNVSRLFNSYECHNGGTPQSYCSTSSSQTVVQQCSYLCSNGACVAQQGECTPGEIRSCGTNTGVCKTGINVCFVDASWSDECFGGISPASEICDGLDNDCDGQTDEGGVCGSGCSDECISGTRECSGSGFRVCGNYDSDSCAEWSSVANCSSGETCQSGSCVAQPPSCSNECGSVGAKECYLDGYRVCGNYDLDSCLEWSLKADCSTGQVCSGGNCVSSPPQCTNECSAVGVKECSGNGYKVCGNYDLDSCLEWSSVASCSTGQTCSNGACVASPPACSNECTPYARECYANGFRVCGNFDLDSCYEWSLPTDCGLGKSCINGACVLN